MNVPVELIVNGKKVRAVSQDISPFGMFIRLSPPLPVGTLVQIVVSPNGAAPIITGQVTHALSEGEARTLGRFPGIGVMFRDPMRPADEEFHEAIKRLLERHADAARDRELRILVADPQTRLLERLSTALGNAGFQVATATNGMEAIGSCLSKAPDVALIERDMPVVDGLHVLQEMGRHAELASVPVMMMSANATDLARLQAFQLGAADFIPKPFTVLEVILRARRWARASHSDTERVVLRGALDRDRAADAAPDVRAGQEDGPARGHARRDRRVDRLRRRPHRARAIVGGRGRRRARGLHARARLEAGLLRARGRHAGARQARADASVTHLLLEHARTRDEAR